MAWGRRCTLGCESWPDLKQYEVCPACGEATTRFSNVRPIGQVEAQAFVNDQLFEDFYERYCAFHGIEYGDGPLPDDFAAEHPLGDLRFDALPGSNPRPSTGGGTVDLSPPRGGRSASSAAVVS